MIAVPLNDDVKMAVRRILKENGDNAGKGGFLVPPQFIVGIVEKAGFPLPSMSRYEEKCRETNARSCWWRWLFHHYTTNALASFIVWRWPKMPSVMRAAGEVGKVYSECLQARHAAALPQWERAIEILAREGEQDANTGGAEQWTYIRLSKESNPGLRAYDKSAGDSLCWAKVVVQDGKTRIFVDDVDVTDRATAIRYYSVRNTVDAVTGYGSVGVMDTWL